MGNRNVETIDTFWTVLKSNLTISLTAQVHGLPQGILPFVNLWDVSKVPAHNLLEAERFVGRGQCLERKLYFRPNRRCASGISDGLVGD